jgi:hypothetical protein
MADYKIGSITSTVAFSKAIVMLHSYDKAIEILDKKGNIFSSRSISPVHVIAGWQDNIALLPYGSKIREARTMLHSELSKKNIGTYAEIQEYTARRFLVSLMKSPEQFFERCDWYVMWMRLKFGLGKLSNILSRFAASIILKAVYGYVTEDEGEDALITMPKKAMLGFAESFKLLPLGSLVSWCEPFLRSNHEFIFIVMLMF